MLIKNFNKLYIYLFILPVLLLLHYPLPAQVPKNNFVQISVDDGLPSNDINDIFQDGFGYIWLATLNGLVRYDGYNFKIYHPDIDNDASIQSNLIVSIFEDKKGDLWIGGLDGLSKYNRENDSFRFFSLSKFQSDTLRGRLGVMGISEDNAGTLWLAVSTSNWSAIPDGVFYLDKAAGGIKKYEFSDSIHTRNMLSTIVTKKGEIWFTGYKGLARLNPNSKKVKFFRPKKRTERNGVFTAIEDDDGMLWLGTPGNNLQRFNPVDSSFKQYSIKRQVKEYNNFNIRDLVFDGNNNLWLATNSGLIYFNLQDESAHHFLPENNNPASISSFNNQSICIDFAGSVWIGSWDKGLNRYDSLRTEFKAFTHNSNDPKGYGPGWAIFIEEDHKKNIWIGTGYSFINRFNKNDETFSRFPENGNTPEGFISSVFEDSQKRLWFGINGYLYQFEADDNKFRELPVLRQYGQNTIHDFYEDDKGSLWFGRDDGFFSFNPNKNTIDHFTLDSFPGASQASNEVNRLIGDPNYNIWIGTNNGLFKFERQTGKISRIGFNEGKHKSLSDQDINSLCIDKSGILWVGTWYGGLNRYNPQTGVTKIYTTVNGLPVNSIQGILEDEKNNTLWMSTFMGITRFDLKNETFLNFDTKDGVHATEFADGAYLKTSQNEFLFGGSNGFTMFKPQNIKENVTPPKVLITDIKLSNQSVISGPESSLDKPAYEADEIILKHDQNDISFEFLALHLINSQRNQYAYILENYETEWRNVGSQRSAIYPNLPPGNYTFRVKAANFNHYWNEEGASVKVTIHYPWWRSVWAYLTYILLVVGIIFAIDRFQRRRLVTRERAAAAIKEAELRAKVAEAENERKSKELEEARQLQLSMLPKQLPQLPHLDIAVYMQTATEVGGDYYDFSLKTDGSLNIALGDATGHGMKAGIMVSSMKSIFSTNSPKMELEDFFATANSGVKSMQLKHLMMGFTMFNIQKNKFKLINAGMPPVYLFRKKSGTVEEITEHSMPIGAMKHSKYNITDDALEKGDVLLLMSDGMPELQNEKGQMYGYERIRDGFEKVAQENSEKIISYLKEEASAWVNDKDPDDDVTFVVLKVK